MFLLSLHRCILRNEMSITQGAEFGEILNHVQRYFSNHIYLVIKNKTPLLLHIEYSQTNTEAILIVLSFHRPLKKERKKKNTGAGKVL